MSGLVQISEAASIGIHACLWLARQQPRLCRSPETVDALFADNK